MPNLPTAQEILQTPISVSDPEIKTLGQYLSRNLHLVWIGLRKSGVLPNGNGLWEAVVVRALIKAGHLRGTIDQFGNAAYIESDYQRLMDRAFDLLETADYSTLQLPPEPKDWYLLEFDADGSLVATEEDPYTKEEAEEALEYANSFTGSCVWKAIHIPL